MKKRPPKTDHRDQATYWFAILEIARERGNATQVREARQQLRRLGVSVKYDDHQEGNR